jgi:4-coumarate--CoA ligase
MAVLRSNTWIEIPDSISISELMSVNSFNTPTDKVIFEEAFTGVTKTYGQFSKDVRQIAHWFKYTFGLKPGQIVSILAPSCIDYITAAQAIWWAGGVVSPINNSLHENEVAHAIDLIKPDYIVAHDSSWGKVLEALKLCLKHRPSKLLTMGKPHDSWPSFPPSISKEAPELEPFSLNGKDPKTTLCAILLSSGTTGRPKAVMLSHYNLVATLYQLRSDNPGNWRPTQREVFFPPLSHVYALYVCITSVFWLGSYVNLMPRFHLERYCQLMQDRRATLARLVPPIAKLLAEDPVVKKYNYPNLEYFSTSAAPINVRKASRCGKGVLFTNTQDRQKSQKVSEERFQVFLSARVSTLAY